MSIEGRTQTAPGERLVYLLTVYEVVGQDQLRPAAGASVNVMASFQRERPVAQVQTDAHGRAQVRIQVPEELDRGIELVIEAVSTSRIRRRFQIRVAFEEERRLELVLDRERAAPGEVIHIWGQVRSAANGRPVAGQQVILTVSEVGWQVPLTRMTATTNAFGTFLLPWTAPDRIETYAVRGRIEETDLGVEGELRVERPERPSLMVRAVPEAQVIEPGAPVNVDVMVRQPNGRPVQGAVLRGLPAPDPEEGTEPQPIRTDATGQARIVWDPGPNNEDPRTIVGRVSATRPGLGQGGTSVVIRIARQRFYADLIAEGGALIPGLEGRLYVRVVGADGENAPEGTAVRLTSARLGEASSQVDASGVAVLEVTPSTRAGGETTSACGGASSAPVTLTIGGGHETSRHERCVPLDPDGTVRVRVTPRVVRSNGEVTITLARAGRARTAPVALALLRRQSGALVPLHHQVVPSGTDEVRLEIPRGASGEVLVRARTLWGEGSIEVRGGSALIWVEPDDVFDLEATRTDAGALSVRPVTSGAAPSDRQATLWLVPLDRARWTADQLARISSTPQGAFLDERDATSALIEALLASRTPPDETAPAVLRGRDAVDLPAPERPEVLGVLRDPWRARARFVSGRLALVIRAIETYVAAALPERIDDVAQRQGRGWVFNRELLDAIAESRALGNEGARGLGGAPLTMEDLEDLDPAFTYDNMARRITRERLLRVLLTLRELVQTRDLDLSWTRRGEPTGWLREIIGRRVSVADRALSPSDLYDGWGRPLELRRARGGRQRFGRLVPVPGYELVSAGPDGRFGTGDDLFDPLARVLPSGGAYAEAVGEDELLARLRGVELSRVTTRRIAVLFDTNHIRLGSRPSAADHGRIWSHLPRPLGPTDSLLGVDRPWILAGGQTRRAQVFDISPTGTTISLETGPEPRAYRAFVLSWSEGGTVTWTSLDLRGGVPLLVETDLPEWIGAGEQLTVPVSISLLEGRTPPISLEIAAEGSISARLGREPNGTSETPPADRTGNASTTFTIQGREGGSGSVRLVVTSGGERWTLEREIAVVERGQLRSQIASTVLVDGRAELPIDMPGDAIEPRGEVVVTSPRALARDPGAAWLLERDPALLAWFSVVTGRPVPPRVGNALRRWRGSLVRYGEWSEALSWACAVVAQSAEQQMDPFSQNPRVAARQELLRWLSEHRFRGSRSRPHSEMSPEDLALMTSLLAALSSGATGVGAEEGDDLTELVDLLRRSVRLNLRTQRSSPALMARSAAALLLADPEDMRGRAMLEIARESLAPGLRGGAVVREDEQRGNGAEEIAATAALAIAARQVGDAELARELALGLAARAPLALELGGEPAFWLLAAAAYGVFGVDHPAEVTVEAESERLAASLAEGVAVVEIPLPRAGRSSEVVISTSTSSGGNALLLARTRVRYLRPAAASEEGPLRAAIEGDPGRLGQSAAWEIRVANSGEERVSRPEILVSLPSAGVLDQEGLAAIREAPSVIRADEPDRRGVVRIQLAPIAGMSEALIPLPIRWIAEGEVSGLAVSAYERDRPWEMSITPARSVTIEAMSDQW